MICGNLQHQAHPLPSRHRGERQEALLDGDSKCHIIEAGVSVRSRSVYSIAVWAVTL